MARTIGVWDASDCWRSWFSAAAPPISVPAGSTWRRWSMVAPVVVVDGPVVGTTWSRVHPALVGPGTAPATPEVWARTAMALACSPAGTTTCRVPGAPAPKALVTW